jgi:tetratricopeptide (TPR) repeat protein
LAILLFLLIFGRLAFAGSPQPRIVLDEEQSAAEIKKLIEQLGSSKFSERETASKRLQEIGKPALDALREAGEKSKDTELRRRVKEIIQIISPINLDAPWEVLLRQGIRAETSEKDYRKAVDNLTKAEKLAEERFHPNPRFGPETDVPILTEIHLHLARCYRELKDWQKAGNAYNRATYYSNFNNDKRKQIDHEWSEMTDKLLSQWEKTVKQKIGKNAEQTKIVADFPLVVLHSRRFAGGGYLKSAYSFKYETVDEEKHGNDVHLLFDNGTAEKTFQVNMVVGQQNLVTDLGDVQFTRNPDPNKLTDKEMKTWEKEMCRAVEGHTYLEKVEDNRGNRFFVVFQILAVDKDSNYLAFVWRRLPGGKIKKDR